MVVGICIVFSFLDILYLLFRLEHHTLLKEVRELTKLNDEGYDVAFLVRKEELEMGMKLLSQFLKQNQNCIQVSQKMNQVHSQINTLTAEVKEAKRHLETHTDLNKGSINEGVEFFLDQCDQLADALDALDESGHTITELEGLYQKLISHLETYQDHVDEL